MLRKKFNFLSLRLAVLLWIVLFFYGCETWRGLQKDIDALKDMDEEFQEEYW